MTSLATVVLAATKLHNADLVVTTLGHHLGGDLGGSFGSKRCMIRSIYNWDRKAEKPAETPEPDAQNP